MKNIILIIAVLLAAITSHAQGVVQNVFKLGQSILNGPWAAGTGYGHSLSGGNSVVYGVICYDFVTNVDNTGFSSGVIGGDDYLWKGNQHEQNTINGGFQIQETFKPLSFVGKTFLTNIVTTVSAYQLVATPKAGGTIGAITGTSLTIDLYSLQGFHLKVAGMYESRAGQGEWNGKYGLIGGFLTHSF